MSLTKKMMVRNRILDEISSGTLSPGVKLEGERTLCARLNVSRVTLSRGLKELERDGILKRRVGSGTYVSDEIPPRLAPLTRKLTLALLVSCVKGPVGINLLNGFHEIWTPEMCDIILKDPAGDPEREMELVKRMVELPVDAIVVSTAFAKNSKKGVGFYRKVLSHVPVVMTDCVLDATDIPSVSLDNFEGGRLAALALLERNPKAGRFVILKFNFGVSTLPPRISGFEKTSAAASVRTKRISLPSDPKSFKRALVKSIAEIAESDGVFTTQGGILPELLNAAARLGIEPRNLNICAFDDFSGVADAFGIPHIEQPFNDMAKKIAQIIKRPNKELGTMGRTTLRPKLVSS
jgi:DNA-binding LacI/PurR family transcriptional regulator